MLGLLRSYIMRAGFGVVVWGSFWLCKGLIPRMLLGGLKVDFESVWVGLELICARCAARFLHSLWAASGLGYAIFGLLGDWLWGVAPNHPNQPKTCATTSLKQPKSYFKNRAAHLALISFKASQTDPKSTINPPNSILGISPLQSQNEPQTTTPKPALII